MQMRRRQFFKTAAMAIGGAMTMGVTEGTLPRRRLGKTGVEVSAIAMGGIVVMNLPQKEADAMVRWAYDLSLIHI